MLTARFGPATVKLGDTDVYQKGGGHVKKLLLLVVAAIGGLLVYRQVQSDKSEQDLWTEATDPVPSA